MESISLDIRNMKNNLPVNSYTSTSFNKIICLNVSIK